MLYTRNLLFLVSLMVMVPIVAESQEAVSGEYAVKRSISSGSFWFRASGAAVCMLAVVTCGWSKHRPVRGQRGDSGSSARRPLGEDQLGVGGSARDARPTPVPRRQIVHQGDIFTRCFAPDAYFHFGGGGGAF